MSEAEVKPKSRADLRWGERDIPPGRRACETFPVYAGTPEVGLQKWLVSAGFRGKFGYGRLFEIFFASGKSGSDVNHMALELGIVTSLALQYGCPEDVIRNAMPRDEQGNPQGVLGAFFDALRLREMADGKKVDA